MLLADKLIKWETGVGTEKGATLLHIINLFLPGFTPEENDLAHWVGMHRWRGGQCGNEGRKNKGMREKGRTEESTRRDAWQEMCRGRAQQERIGVGRRVKREWMKGRRHWWRGSLAACGVLVAPDITDAIAQNRGHHCSGAALPSVIKLLLPKQHCLPSVQECSGRLQPLPRHLGWGTSGAISCQSCLQVFQDPSYTCSVAKAWPSSSHSNSLYIFWCGITWWFTQWGWLPVKHLPWVAGDGRQQQSLRYHVGLASRFSSTLFLAHLIVISHPCRSVLVNLCSRSSVPSSSRWKRVPLTQSLGRPGTHWVRTSLSDSRLITKHWWVLWAFSTVSLFTFF